MSDILDTKRESDVKKDPISSIDKKFENSPKVEIREDENENLRKINANDDKQVPDDERSLSPIEHRQDNESVTPIDLNTPEKDGDDGKE